MKIKVLNCAYHNHQVACCDEDIESLQIRGDLCHCASVIAEIEGETFEDCLKKYQGHNYTLEI